MADRLKYRNQLNNLADIMGGLVYPWTPERLGKAYEKGMLAVSDLEVGSYYYGYCRNADVAKWDGNKFIYVRHKWGRAFPEEVEHPANDDGWCDIFVPVCEIEPFPEEVV